MRHWFSCDEWDDGGKNLPRGRGLPFRVDKMPIRNRVFTLFHWVWGQWRTRHWNWTVRRSKGFRYTGLSITWNWSRTSTPVESGSRWSIN